MKTSPLKPASVLVLLALSAAATAQVARPTQYVALAFDNCTENSRWSELSSFTKQMRSAAKPVGFTFFVSGVNFIPSADRKTYTGPGHKAGVANIDFGGTREEVKERIHHMHDLRELGGEIASHAVGHFDGAEWSVDQWMSELGILNSLVRTGFDREGFDGKAILKDIVGFRAPYLSENSAMYSALERQNYRYDTSTDSDANAWPKKRGKLWIFPLANLKIAGSGKKTLSMDYNFFATQSGAKDQPALAATFEKQMLETYLQYFRSNYAGNRAPLNIGHHFFGYQGGAYNRALKTFAEKVCGLSEVKCVTYTELANVMDATDAATLAAFRKGQFPKKDSPL